MNAAKLLSIALLLSLSSSAVIAQWKYRTTEDKMRGKSTKHAELRSPTRVALAFPYNGGSTLTLALRQEQDADLDAFVYIDKGQMPCHGTCTVAVKFDDEPVQYWPALGTTSPRSTAVFFRQEATFLDRLRSAKKLIVEVHLYDHGHEQFTFHLRGLKWE